MRKYVSFIVEDSEQFKKQLLFYLKKHQISAIYDSCNYKSSQSYSAYDFIAGFEALQTFTGGLQKLKEAFDIGDWALGYLAYDLKNELEHIYSVNHDGLQFENTSFFRPRFLFLCNSNSWQFSYLDDYNTEAQVLSIIDEIKNIVTEEPENKSIKIKQRVNKTAYLKSVKGVLDHIHRGDIYEMNYCMEFYAEHTKIDPFSIYNSLHSVSPTPFSSFFKMKDKHIICASPERYICKRAQQVITQPIKGTAKRSADIEVDKANKSKLKESIKEQSENIMIVDLVRNDLSKIAERGSVKVDELCGIYPFKQVFQMISTVSAKLNHSNTAFDVIKATFPMGSMTGAPKLRATKLIEKYEETKRGAYSGAMGYITPNQDFDFNVIIRSILYNSAQEYLSFMVGSAITAKSNPAEEYEECLLKAKAIFEVLRAK
ncbi:anthranilate synthase component I family protein [Saccharicrinis aurantiacus]|uniref:anthranilate synthase component I family protein n=1 Tax=Saccharicrinis aurantiacus TaxID=1849719 RepID=UPI00249274F3|nr:anthranilate synthase component I family protein [Saccharicrinis aurantiacus]